jgi:hypothetical protein
MVRCFIHRFEKLLTSWAEAMKLKVYDPDDKVRAAVCKAYGELDFETAAYHVSEETLRQIGSRSLDRKVSGSQAYRLLSDVSCSTLFVLRRSML